MAQKPLSIDIRHPLVLKANELALLTEEDGDIPGDVVGFGLFYRDTCYLARYRLRLAGAAPLLLGSSDELGVAARIALTNPGLKDPQGPEVRAHALQIERSLVLVSEDTMLADLIEIKAFCAAPIHLELTLDLGSEFRNVLALRGAGGEIRGKRRAPVWDGHQLRLSYAGADNVTRSLIVEFSPTPILSFAEGSAIARFGLDLEPREAIAVTTLLRIEEDPANGLASEASRWTARAILSTAEQSCAELLADFASFHSNDSDLDRVMHRSLSDVALLGVRRDECAFTAAGLPWYLGLFGRDSLIPSLQVLAYNPELSARNVRALASYQGVRLDDRTGEEPGRILHELRVGELANLGAIPQTPSYFSVDSTLLFLVALARHVRWTGDAALFRDLRGHIDRALAWIDRREEASARGFVEYRGLAKSGALRNEAWRDSDDGVLRADGVYPEPPLALVEVQGYAFMARREVAAVLRRLGEEVAADQLERRANDLAERFDQAFWMEREGCYSLALERDGRQVGSISSNTAHVLWTGIARSDRAEQIARRIIQSDMFSGWGVRTLSADHPRYDPFAYQQGSVWPFDNAFIVSGLRRYGADEAAVSIFQATFAAALAFRDGRLPEFLAGVERRAGARPARSPRADPMQAWSASAIPFMVTELLGLEVDGFERRILARRPILPDGLSTLRIEDVRLGDGVATVCFDQRNDGPVEVSLKSAGSEFILEVVE
ncbi:MAG TPA: glycogen debranching N-terminal domain-containing protein [Caulobacteraceae bacterium]